MNLDAFLKKIQQTPNHVDFNETIAVIDTYYDFTPRKFANGNIVNEAGRNNGSCKIFSFGLLHNLSKQQTLACFGKYYRHDVLIKPEGDDHQNIRQFMISGWSGIQFDDTALTPKDI